MTEPADNPDPGTSPDNPDPTPPDDNNNPPADDGGEKSWLDALPEAYHENASLKTFTSVEALAKSYINQQKLVGRDKIPVPTNDEEIDAVLMRLGVPDEAKSYELSEFEIPEGMGVGDDDANSFKEVAHSAKLTPKQAKIVHDAFMNRSIKSYNNFVTDKNEKSKGFDNALKGEWGEKFDYNMGLAEAAVQQEGDEEFFDFLKESGLSVDPRFAKFAHNIGMKVVEDGFVPGNPNQGGKTPMQLESEIGELTQHPAYLDKDHMEHNVIVKKVYALRQRMHGDA